MLLRGKREIEYILEEIGIGIARRKTAVRIFEQLIGRGGLIVNMIKTTRTTKTKMMKPESVESEAKKVEPAKIQVAKLEPVQTSAPVKMESFKAPAPKSEQPRVNHISLSYLKPDAKKVCVAGTFNGWKPERTPLKPAGNGRWIGDLMVDPGKYEYLFVVDGQWLPDPNAKESVENPFGGRNSVLVVSA